MTIRWKLNLAMLAMLVTFLLAGVIVLYSVHAATLQSLSIARMRTLSVFTDDVRAGIFAQMAVAGGLGRDVEDLELASQNWPADILEGIDVRVRLASDAPELEGWTRVREIVSELGNRSVDDPEVPLMVHRADVQLRKLSRHYDTRIATATAEAANTSTRASTSVAIAILMSAMIFALVTLLIRDWLAKPIQILNHAAEEIGSGNLSHRVPLDGHDELAHLARAFDAMAKRLARHQKELVEARELAAIGELCSNVAHGLRNPLAGMRASAQLAARRVADTDPVRETLDDIIEEVDCMDRRISQLFEFGRPANSRKRRSASQRLPTKPAPRPGLSSSQSTSNSRPSTIPMAPAGASIASRSPSPSAS